LPDHHSIVVAFVMLAAAGDQVRAERSVLDLPPQRLPMRWKVFSNNGLQVSTSDLAVGVNSAPRPPAKSIEETFENVARHRSHLSVVNDHTSPLCRRQGPVSLAQPAVTSMRCGYRGERSSP